MPSTRTFPEVGTSSVVIWRTRVVLPAPLGPNTPSASPQLTESEMSRLACGPSL